MLNRSDADTAVLHTPQVAYFNRHNAYPSPQNYITGHFKDQNLTTGIQDSGAGAGPVRVKLEDQQESQQVPVTCFRDRTEGSISYNRGQGNRFSYTMSYSGPKNINITEAAERFLIGRMETQLEATDTDSGSDSGDGSLGNMLDKHITHDPLNCSRDTHSRYDLGHVHLVENENFMARGSNVPERSTEEREAESAVFETGKRQIIETGSHEGPGGKKARHKYRPSRPPLLPPCRVCGDRASGFHYGVNTCEACKGFFRRSICKAQPYVCTGNGDCKPTPGKRTACSHCRFKRCIEVGMSKNAIKTGRYTHELRSKNILEVKRLQNQNNEDGSDDTVSIETQKHLNNEEFSYPAFENEMKKKVLLEETLQMLIRGQHHLFENLDEYYDDKLMKRRQLEVYNRFISKSKDSDCFLGEHVHGLFSSAMVNIKTEDRTFDFKTCASLSCGSASESRQTSENTHHIEQLKLEENTSAQSFAPTIGPRQSVSSVERTKAEVMSHILKDIEQGVNGMLSFSKSIPGFTDLPKNDKAALIKSARFDVWYIGHIRCFNAELRVGACDWQFHADELAQVWGSDLVDLSFKMSSKGHVLDLTKEETAALRAVCLTMPDRCVPLENPAEVEQMHARMWEVFRFASEKRQLDFHRRLPKVINFLLLLREFGIKFESISSQLMLDWSVLKENPLLLSVFLT